MNIPIKTVRFTVREMVHEDAPALMKNIQSERIYKGTYRIPNPYTFKVAKDFIDERIESYKSENPKSLLFAIDIDGEMVGDVGFKYVLGHKAELVYWLADKHAGKGVMTEAAKLICDYGFEELKLARIYAEIYTYNKDSQKVVEKLGFIKEGEHKKWLVKDGEFKDIYYYAKFN